MDLQKTPSDAPSPIPGWYADPEHAGSERYWDGTFWSDQRRPAGSSVGTASATGTAPPPSNGFAVTALVCGIVGVVLFWTVFGGFILGVIAIVFGVLARKRADNEPDGGKRGMATAGFVLGIVAVAGTIAYLILIALLVDTTSNLVNDSFYCIDHPNASECN